MTQDLRERVVELFRPRPGQSLTYQELADAALTVALEEAARIVQEKSDRVGDVGPDGWEDRCRDLDEVAAAIRALIPKA